MYYYKDKYFDEMKILPSSPYAVFNAKEWNALVNCRKKFNKNKKYNLHKYYYQNLKQYNIDESIQKEIKKNKLIQLSFA